MEHASTTSTSGPNLPLQCAVHEEISNEVGDVRSALKLVVAFYKLYCWNIFDSNLCFLKILDVNVM